MRRPPPCAGRSLAARSNRPTCLRRDRGRRRPAIARCRPLPGPPGRARPTSAGVELGLEVPLDLVSVDRRRRRSQPARFWRAPVDQHSRDPLPRPLELFLMKTFEFSLFLARYWFGFEISHRKIERQLEAVEYSVRATRSRHQPISLRDRCPNGRGRSAGM